MTKDIRDLIREAARRGWTVTHCRSGHLKWRHPKGVVHSSLTPSDRNATRQIERDLRRVEGRQS
jgi:hypothetical protein